MIIKTRGIVLKTTQYSETSLICKILTEERGLKSYIISGVRKKKGKTSAGLLQVMSILDLVVYDSQKSNLHRIKELNNHYVYHEVPYDLVKGSIGLFIIEIVQKTIKGEEEHQELFQYLLDTLQFLDQTKTTPANLHLHFLLEYASHLGFGPSGVQEESQLYFHLWDGRFMPIKEDKYALNQELSTLISELLHLSVEEVHTIEMSRETRHQLLRQLLNYFKLHVDNFPEINAHRILKEVF